MLLLSEYNILEKFSSKSNKLLYRAERCYDRQRVILKILESRPLNREHDGLHNNNPVLVDPGVTGIARCLALETYNNQHVMVLQDLPGITLEHFLQLNRIRLREAIVIAIQITDILQYLYNQGLVCQDVSPANFIIDQSSLNIHLIDFSLHIPASEEAIAGDTLPFVHGAFAYISPEQTGRIRAEIDCRSNLYSLGVILYQMVTGRLPFESTEALSLIHSHIARNPLPPHNIEPGLPKTVSRLIMKLLSKAAADRYQAPFGLKSDLERCLSMLEVNTDMGLYDLGQQDFSGRLHQVSQFYGREKEIVVLEKAYNRVNAEATGIVLIEGFSGIGKSALVNHFKGWVFDQGGRFVQSKFNQFQKNIPYFGFSQALTGFVDYVLAQQPGVIAGWKESILQAVGINGRVLTDVIPHLQSLIGPQPAVAELEPRETQNRFYYVFINFLKCISRRDQTLVVFFDDLQWADAASVSLLKVISADKSINHLLFIGAYRNNEITAESIFSFNAGEIGQPDIEFEKIILAPLPYDHVKDLILEMLGAGITDDQSLIDLVNNKSEGNPFFIKTFLKTLYAENILAFNFTLRQWNWNRANIQYARLGDSIVELMTGRIKKMPAFTQELLKLASCLGYQFDVELLAVVVGEDVQTVLLKLQPALEEDLVVLQHNFYCFTHDRIQQAAYSLLPADQKKNEHLKIGMALLTNLRQELRNLYIFEIVNQLNAAIEKLEDAGERLLIAELNVEAGNKAKSSAAYNPSFEYFLTGTRFLPTGAWNSHYNLALTLHTEGAESAFLSGNGDIMQQWIDVVLANAVTTLDKVRVYEVRIKYFIAQYRQLDAVKTGLEILALLDVRFPATPNKLHVLEALISIRLKLLVKPSNHLRDRALVGDPLIEAAIRILVSVGSAVIFAPPFLFPLMVCKAFSLMINHGNSPYSGILCSSYGMVILKSGGNIRDGFSWGTTAIQLSQQFETNSYKCQTRFLVYSFFMHWKEHLKNTLEPLYDNYWFGLENGNIEFATYSAFNHCQNAFFCGINLRSVTDQNKKFHHRFRSHKNEYAINMHNVCSQAAINLFELADEPTILSGVVCDEKEMIATYVQAQGKRELFKIYLYKLILAYQFEKFDEAETNGHAAAQYLKSALGNPEIIVFYFYHLLSILKLIPRYSGAERTGVLRTVRAAMKVFRELVRPAPMNGGHKLLLVEAELARVTGQLNKARQLYNQAIAAARENEYRNDLALAFELAAKFYAALYDESLAASFFQQAYTNYQQWGAFNKLRDLDKRYTNFLHNSGIGLKNDSALPHRSVFEEPGSAGSLQKLDLHTIMKAAMALSSEVQLDRLLNKLTKIAVESAGARNGYLVLYNDDAFYVEARSSIDEKEDKIFQSMPLAGNQMIAEPVIHFVAATKESLVIGNAMLHPHFSLDRVIVQKKSKSVLCTPIMQQGELIGLLYFENELITDAFTPDRIELLQLLSGQMAISLQNAINEHKKMIALQDREKLVEQINTQRQELLKTKLEIQEQTIQNISGEIHDNIGQTLSFIKLSINTIDINKPELAREKLGESRQLLTKVIQELRDLAKTLNPDTIDRIGLVESIDLQLQFLRRTGVFAATLAVSGDICKYESQRELVIFRVVQELLNNVIKHSEATAIDICVDYQADKLVIDVTDNGKGFDVQQQYSTGNKGMGLRNISNRMALIRGNISFESTGQKGTRASLEVMV